MSCISPTSIRPYLIGPVVRENRPQKIKRALYELGCSCVIAEGSVPDSVTAEICSAQMPDVEKQEDLTRSLYLKSEWDTVEDVRWGQGVFPGLRETGRWLMEQAKQAVRDGLRPSFDKAIKDSLMTWWMGQGIDIGWHCDKAELPDYPDNHIHIFGRGLKIADSHCSQIILVDRNLHLKSLFANVSNIVKTQAEFDQALQRRDFGIVTLQPGEKAYFGAHCLHSSDQDAPGQMKLRAGMF